MRYGHEEEKREWSQTGEGGVHTCLLKYIFEGVEEGGLHVTLPLSPLSPPGPPSMLAPFLAMHCRNMGPVLSYRNRFDNWRVI